MNIDSKSPAHEVNFGFARQIAGQSGQPLNLCFQCQKCSCGCPVSEHADFKPSQLIRLLQYGLIDELLASRMIWLCSGCETCGARCPNGISVGRVTDALKEMALAQKKGPGKNKVLLFHREFLGSVRAHGRVHEAAMLVSYKIKSGQLFNDLKLGLAMFRKGKLTVLPARVKDRGQVKKIFDRVLQLRATGSQGPGGNRLE